MLCTAFSFRNTDNWYISNLTVHVNEWASAAVTFFKNKKNWIIIS